MISNAIKFTQSGGSVTITCKKITSVLDLTFGEDSAMQEIVLKSKFGMIEMIV